jgi:hypothetical protein
MALMEAEKVYWLRVADGEGDEAVCRRLERELEKLDLLSMLAAQDLVAVKTHFGEEGSAGYVRPIYLRMLGELIRQKKALPFLTETSTLYSGRRHNAIQHIGLAQEHGFGFDNTKMPLIMADGLRGDQETEVALPGEIYQRVKIAALFAQVQALVLVSHFTGHLATGFGAALKNLGMGCSSRRGKMEQHSTAKPTVHTKKCTGCAVCSMWCPQQAITLGQDKARINAKLCIGCGECLAVCRFDAIGYNWSATYEQLQKKMVEHAWGVARSVGNKILCLNFLTRISRDCDCLGRYEKIFPDIGVLIASDPVAVDAAALDLLEKTAGKTLDKLAYQGVPFRVQIEHARRIGFGSPEYRLEELA